MNTWNDVESQLKSWKLRPPSPSIKARLFPPEETAAAEWPGLSLRYWLAPAMAMCFLLLMVSQGGNSRWAYLAAAQSSNLLATVEMNRPELASYFAPPQKHVRNTWSAAVFECTNDSLALSAPAVLPRTNESFQ